MGGLQSAVCEAPTLTDPAADGFLSLAAEVLLSPHCKIPLQGAALQISIYHCRITLSVCLCTPGVEDN